jgi:hypothetical protein
VEIGEEVKVLIELTQKDPLCQGDKEPEKRGWQCRVGKPGDPGDLSVPTAEQLYSNMKQAKAPIPDDPPRKGEFWDLDQCTSGAHPFQSHHLIPKMHLPNHDVCVWLAMKAKNKQWELIESTNYDTDDANNGMSLPFASTTHQWKKTGNPTVKEEICNKMMKQTGKQLHQGSHTYADYGEEDQLHEKEQPGYLGAVDELLKVVNGQTLNHVRLCPDCKKSASAPWQVRPLEKVVASMHQVSRLMGGIITGHKRFVSERAAKYFGAAKS